MACVSIRTCSISVGVFLIDIMREAKYLIFQVFFGLGLAAIQDSADCLSEVS